MKTALFIEVVGTTDREAISKMVFESWPSIWGIHPSGGLKQGMMFLMLLMVRGLSRWSIVSSRTEVPMVCRAEAA